MMKDAALITRLLHKAPDGVYHCHSLGLTFPTREAAENQLAALLPDLARRAGRDLVLADFARATTWH